VKSNALNTFGCSNLLSVPMRMRLPDEDEPGLLEPQAAMSGAKSAIAAIQNVRRRMLIPNPCLPNGDAADLDGYPALSRGSGPVSAGADSVTRALPGGPSPTAARGKRPLSGANF
jgi:hypothetical protein